MNTRFFDQRGRLRVSVLPASPASLAAGDSLVAQAATAAGGCTHLIQVQGELIGFARTAVQQQTLCFEWLEIVPARRNLGLGGEAVLALERAHAGIRKARADLPAGNGLAVYFWLRAGYRPVFGAPGDAGEGTVMLRMLR